MRILTLIFLVLLPVTTLTAQSLPEWDRVYTFDDSTIEMNTTLVTFINNDVSRVRFRWSFNEPQPLEKDSNAKYQSRLEVMELNCSVNQYRPFHLTFYDAAGKIVLVQDKPGQWRTVRPGGMTEKLFVPGCELIKNRKNPPPIDHNKVESDRVALYVYQLWQQLERTKDFRPIIDRYFAVDYLDGYLADKKQNWFLNLDREMAARVSRKELRRYYLALLNATYLSSVYLISIYPDSADRVAASRLSQLVPADVWKLIRNHPYTAAYQHKQNNYDFLAEQINNVRRLNLYIDLLERIAVLMRRHLLMSDAQHSKQYREMLVDSGFDPSVRVCEKECLGLPQGTKLFQVSIPVFQLQLAEIKGSLKIVSALPLGQ